MSEMTDFGMPCNLNISCMNISPIWTVFKLDCIRIKCVDLLNQLTTTIKVGCRWRLRSTSEGRRDWIPRTMVVSCEFVGSSGWTAGSGLCNCTLVQRDPLRTGNWTYRWEEVGCGKVNFMPRQCGRACRWGLGHEMEDRREKGYPSSDSESIRSQRYVASMVVSLAMSFGNFDALVTLDMI